MADLTISVDIDAKATRVGADQAKGAIRDVAGEGEKLRRSVAGIDFAALGSKLKAVGAQMQQFGGQLRSVGTSLSLAVTLPIFAIGKSILTAGAEYEKALNIFQAVTKATSAEMDRAAKVAQDLGADLSLPATSAKDAALAMNELGKAGLTASQAMDAAKGVLQLAAAGQLDEARAAEIAANALNAFNLKASETVRVADLLAAASNASSSEVDDLALSLSQAAAVFASAKIPIEDLTTAIAIMANAGVKGSDAGTSLKQFLLSIEAPTKTAAATMKQLGVEVFDTSGKLREMPDILGQFETALAGLNDQQAAAALQKIFGSDAIRAAQILFSTGTAGFDKMKEAVTANGAAAELANARMKGLAGAWEGFKSQLETIGITLYNSIKAPLTSVLQSLGEFAGNFGDAFSTLSPGVQQVAIAFAALLAALGPALVIIGSVISAVGTLAAAFGTVSAAIGAAGGLGTVLPIIAAAIVGIGLAIAPVVVWAQVLYTAWQTNFGGIRDLTAIVAQAISDAWDYTMAHLRDLTQQVLAEVQKFWQENGDQIMGIVKEFSDQFRAAWTQIVQFWRENHDTIKVVADAIWVAIKDVIVGTVKVIADVIRLVLAVINGDWAKAWDAIKDIVVVVLKAIVSVITAWGTTVAGAVRLALQAVWDLANWVKDQGMMLGANLGQGFVNGIMSFVDPVGAAARYLGNAAVNAIRTQMKIQSPSKVMHEMGQFVAEGFADGITDNAPAVAAAATGMSGQLLGGLKGLIGGDLTGFLDNTFSVLTDRSKSWGDKLKTIFSGIAQNFKGMITSMLNGGGGSGPGGTPNFNPNAGGIFSSTAGATGSIDAAGNYTVNGSSQSGGGLFGNLFKAPTNPFTGKQQSAFSGYLSGAGSIAQMIGGAIGGRTGGVIQYAGMGLQIGSMFGPIGAGIGAGIGALVGLFMGDPKKKKDQKENMPKLQSGITDALAQLRQLVVDVRTLRIAPDAAISKATELRGALASGFGIAFESKKYKGESAKLIMQRLAEADTIIAELRQAADVARAAGDRDRRMLPEFAGGVFMSPAFQNFRRQNGMLGGTFTGRDTIPAMLAHGEMVLNPSQINRVKATAGFDVFKPAGIPGYASGGMATASPIVTMGNINVTVHVEQDAQGIWHATAQSDAGQKVIADVVSTKYSNDELTLRRRGR